MVETVQVMKTLMQEKILDVPSVTKESSARRETVNETAVKAFKHITDAWGFDQEQKIATLGLKDAKELKSLIDEPEKLTKYQLGRVSYVLNMYDDLHALLGDEESANSWLERTHKSGKILLRGKTPLQCVLSGDDDDIREACGYLASVCNR